jgi:hypothetical protein
MTFDALRYLLLDFTFSYLVLCDLSKPNINTIMNLNILFQYAVTLMSNHVSEH